MAVLELIEALFGVVWLIVFVSAAIRGIGQAMRRAEQEAKRRAGQNDGTPAKRVIPTQWTAQQGQAPEPVILVDLHQPVESDREGDSLETVAGEQEQAEDQSDAGFEAGEPFADDGMTEDARQEWERERVHAWNLAQVGGSLGDDGEPLEEFAVADGRCTAHDDAIDISEDDVGSPGWMAPSGDWQAQIISGIVWGTVLGPPVSKSGAHRKA